MWLLDSRVTLWVASFTGWCFWGDCLWPWCVSKRRGEMACCEREFKTDSVWCLEKVSRRSRTRIMLPVAWLCVQRKDYAPSLLTKRIIFKTPDLTWFSHVGKMSILFLKCWEGVFGPSHIQDTLRLNGKCRRALCGGCWSYAWNLEWPYLLHAYFSLSP